MEKLIPFSQISQIRSHAPPKSNDPLGECSAPIGLNLGFQKPLQEREWNYSDGISLFRNHSFVAAQRKGLERRSELISVSAIDVKHPYNSWH